VACSSAPAVALAQADDPAGDIGVEMQIGISVLEALVRRSRKYESSFGLCGETGSGGELVESAFEGGGGGGVCYFGGGGAAKAVVTVGVEAGDPPTERGGAVAVGWGMRSMMPWRRSRRRS
jgi:hypothetical protein